MPTGRVLSIEADDAIPILVSLAVVLRLLHRIRHKSCINLPAWPRLAWLWRHR